MHLSLRLLTPFLALLVCAAPALAETPKPVQAILDRARALMVSDPEEGSKPAAEAEGLALHMPEGRDRMVEIATAPWRRSEAFLRLDDATKARPLIARTLNDIASIKEPIKLRGDLLLSLGSLQMDDGLAAAALKSYQDAFAIFQALGEKRSQALARSYMASLYWEAGDYKQAESYYGQAIEAYDGDPSLSLSFHNNRGNVLLTLERYDAADAEYGEALKYARRLRSALMEARVLANIARGQAEAGHLAAAEQTLARGFALTRDPNALELRRL